MSALRNTNSDSSARMKRSFQIRFAINPFSSSRDAAKREMPLFFIQSVASPSYCLTAESSSSGTYKDKQQVLLSPCNSDSRDQLFAYDPTSSYVHPAGKLKVCVDFDTAHDGDLLRVFGCDRYFRRYQTWKFYNNSVMLNEKSRKCLQKAGEASLEQRPCLEKKSWFEKQQHWSWVPKEDYPGLSNGRMWVW